VAFIESNTGFRANHISASSMTVNSLSGSLVSSASFGSVEIAGFSGQTNLLDFSASIATVSGSVSTRLSSLESGTTTKTLISSSAQIADDISGSFAAASASFATTTTTNTSNISTNTGNISTNTGNITTLQGRSIATGTGLSGGGDLSGDRTLAVDFTDATLQSNISGAFSQASGGLSSRIAVMEGDAANAQGLATTNSPTFAGMTIQGDLTAENIIVSSSIVHFTQSFSSGSTVFGDTVDDTHTFTGSIQLSGSGVQLSISNNGGSDAPFTVNGNTNKVANLNADLLDDTSLDAIPAYVATNLAANALSGDKISGGTIDSTTITKLAIGDLSIGSVNDNELHVREVHNVNTISGSAGASASIDYIEAAKDGNIAGNLVQTINVTFSGNDFLFNGDTKPNFTLLPGYTYRFNQEDSSNASHLIGFKNAGSDYTTGVRNVGTAGSAVAGKAQSVYTELVVTSQTPGLLTYYDKTEGDDASGAKLVKEGAAGGASLISGSLISTGSFGRLEMASGTFLSGSHMTLEGHVSSSLVSTGSFGTMQIAGFAEENKNLTFFSSSIASRVQSAVAGGVNTVTGGTGLSDSGTNDKTLAIDFADATLKAVVSGSWQGQLSSSNSTVVGGGVSGSAASTFKVGVGGVQIANHLKDNQKTHVGTTDSGKYYAISGSAVSTGSFGRLETVEGASLGNGVSGSLTSTGSFGHMAFATSLSASAGTTASFDNVGIRGFSAAEVDRVSTNHGSGLLAFSASVAQRLADEMDDIEGQFTVVGNDIQSVKSTRISGSLTVSASHATSASLTVQGQGENVFNVDGTAGRLFTISDTMSGSLFSVADFSGLAALEVFDNDRITLGLNTNPIVVETNITNNSAQISGSLQSTASFGQVVAADKAVLKDVDLSGNLVPTTDVATDLGSANKRFANLFVGDLLLSNKTRINPDTERIGNSIDGTWGDYQLQEGHEDLFIENKRTGKTFRFVLQEVKTEEL